MPLSIISLGSYLEERNVEVEYYDERIHPHTRFVALVKSNPDYIGFSTMTCFQIKSSLKLAKKARKINPDIPLVWGGVHPSMCIEQTLESPYVDYVIKKEGEGTLYDFTKFIKKESTLDISQIKGLCWMDNGKIHINEDRGFIDIDNLPFPYIGKAEEILLEYIKIPHSMAPVGMELSRGCPYNCGFCYNAFFNNHVSRTKSIEKIERELRLVKDKYKVDRFSFYDDSLCGGNRKKVEQLCELTCKMGLKWQSSIRVNYIDEKMVQLFERGNCEHIFLGVETSDDTVLKKMGKGANSKMNNNAIRCLSKAKIDVSYSLVIGHPYETEEMLMRQFDYVDEIRRMHPTCGIGVQPFLALPGTAMYDEAIKLGFEPPHELIKWAKFTHDEVCMPWTKNAKRLLAVYLITFLAFRYSRYLSKSKVWFIYYLLHKLSMWRWGKRYFNYFMEGMLFSIYKKVGKILANIQRKLESSLYW